MNLYLSQLLFGTINTIINYIVRYVRMFVQDGRQSISSCGSRRSAQSSPSTGPTPNKRGPPSDAGDKSLPECSRLLSPPGGPRRGSEGGRLSTARSLPQVRCSRCRRSHSGRSVGSGGRGTGAGGEVPPLSGLKELSNGARGDVARGCKSDIEVRVRS